MLSESTATLVEHIAVLANPEWAHIKGTVQPVPARWLLAIKPRHDLVARTKSSLVGRRSKMEMVRELVQRGCSGR